MKLSQETIDLLTREMNNFFNNTLEEDKKSFLNATAINLTDYYSSSINNNESYYEAFCELSRKLKNTINESKDPDEIRNAIVSFYKTNESRIEILKSSISSKKDLDMVINQNLKLSLSHWIDYALANKINPLEMDETFKTKFINNKNDDIHKAQNVLNSRVTNFTNDIKNWSQMPISFFDEYFINSLKEKFNDTNNLINNLPKHFTTFLNLNLTTQKIREVQETFRNFYKEIKNNTGNCISIAEKYEENNNKKESAADFLENKNLSEDIVLSVDFENSTFKRYIKFKDKSIAVEHSNGKISVIFDNIELAMNINSILKENIEFSLRKHPTLSNKIKEMISLNIHHEKYITNAINTYLENENILKASKFDLFEHLNKIEQSDLFNFEDLDDEMHKSILNHKVKKFAHSIISNKYSSLLNEESYIIMKQIYELQIDDSQLQNLIGKKIASFKSSEEFNDGLLNVVNIFNSFEPEIILNKIQKIGSKLISFEDNIMIMQITSFEQSKYLGSASWCISRNNSYFTSYTENNNKQYFVYDFNKNSMDVSSMIGITLEEDGKINTAHLKDDDHIGKSDKYYPFIEKMALKIKSSQEKSNIYTLKNSLKI